MKKKENPFLGKRFKYNPDLKNDNMSSIALESQTRFKAKIKDGTYRYEACACYCGNEDSILMAERDSFCNYYPFVICRKCGIMRANPRLTKEAYMDFYTYEYRTLYGDDDRGKDEFFKEGMKHGQDLYDLIIKHVTLPPEAIVFDIGCNFGQMLLPFYENGCDVMGVDYGAENIKYGKEKLGLKLEIGGIERLREFGKKANLVILNHVFEHFLNLDEELKQIRKVMKPGALIYIAVPGTFWFIENGYGGNTLGLLQNAHTWQFSLETLKYVMECNEFELIFGNDVIHSIFRNSNRIKRSRNEVPIGEFEKVTKYLEYLEKRFFPQYFIIEILKKLGLKNSIKKLIRPLRSKSFLKML